MIVMLAGATQAQQPAASIHIVRPGESLGMIAQNYGVDMSALASSNNISNAHLIYSWQALTIPAGSQGEADLPAAHGSHIVRRGESLTSIADFYGIDLSELVALNNIWGWVYPGDELALPIPAGGTQPETPEEQATPEPRPAPAEPEETPIPSDGTLIVSWGDTLGKIAQRYGVSLDDLQALNQLRSTVIYVGQALEIPAGGTPPEADAPEEQATPEPSPAPSEPARAIEASGFVYRVRVGDALGKIAQRYGVSLDDLQALNQLRSTVIYVGQALEIPAGGTPPEADAPVEQATPEPVARSSEGHIGARPTEAETHTVKRGETLFSIARQYGISLDALLRANGIVDAQTIHAGNVLRINPTAASAPSPAPVSAEVSAPAAHTSSPAPAPVGDRARYVVKRGDFLTQLGIDLDTSWRALAKLNNIEDLNNLHVGTVLLIPNREDVERYDPEYAAWKWFDVIGNQPGPRIGVGREIVIVLGTQSTYAYEDGVLQKGVRVSTGKRATPTIQGDHKVWLKRRSQTMSGPGYSLDNVEWVMYFYLDYAMHGAWWHMNFGQPMSRGCVNLTNADAQWFYNFASIGTPVYVRV